MFLHGDLAVANELTNGLCWLYCLLTSKAHRTKAKTVLSFIKANWSLCINAKFLKALCMVCPHTMNRFYNKYSSNVVFNHRFILKRKIIYVIRFYRKWVPCHLLFLTNRIWRCLQCDDIPYLMWKNLRILIVGEICVA